MGDIPGGLAEFALISVLMEVTPGPNMAYLAILALSDGRRAGFAAVAGVALGLGIVGAAAALGVGAMIEASPALYQTLRWGGVAYLLWLAWTGWREADEPPEHAPQGSSLGRFFTRGLVTNLLNPKAAAFYVAVLPGFVDRAQPVLAQTLSLSGIYVAIATLVHLSIVVLATQLRRFLTDPHRMLVARRVLSVMLVGVAIWLGIKTA